VVSWPELSLRITGSPEIGHVMLYSPEHAICVEPQTTTVNAFQLAAAGVKGTGTRTVKPGKPLVATTTWSWGKA
jgi:aldose 1-epimerase